MVEFVRTFSAAEFATAVAIVHQEAASFGATDSPSVFDERKSAFLAFRKTGTESLSVRGYLPFSLSSASAS